MDRCSTLAHRSAESLLTSVFVPTHRSEARIRTACRNHYVGSKSFLEEIEDSMIGDQLRTRQEQLGAAIRRRPGLNPT
jgi:hypothetical protein